jgi:ferredoxin
VTKSDSVSIEINDAVLKRGSLATGDYFCKLRGKDDILRLISGNSENIITISPQLPWKEHPLQGDIAEIYIRLQKPFVDPAKCTGCGICEHECPVRSKRAIRVTSDNESRNKTGGMII